MRIIFVSTPLGLGNDEKSDGLRESLLLSRAQWAARCHQLAHEWKMFPSVTQAELMSLQGLSGDQRESVTPADLISLEEPSGNQGELLQEEPWERKGRGDGSGGGSSWDEVIAGSTLISFEGRDAIHSVLPKELFDSIFEHVDARLGPQEIWNCITYQPAHQELLDRSLAHWLSVAHTETDPDVPNHGENVGMNRMVDAMAADGAVDLVEPGATPTPSRLEEKAYDTFRDPQNFSGYPSNFAWIDIGRRQ